MVTSSGATFAVHGGISNTLTRISLRRIEKVNLKVGGSRVAILKLIHIKYHESHTSNDSSFLCGVHGDHCYVY